MDCVKLALPPNGLNRNWPKQSMSIFGFVKGHDELDTVGVYTLNTFVIIRVMYTKIVCADILRLNNNVFDMVH